MFVLTTKSTVADKAIAALVATAMVLWGVGAHETAKAAAFDSFSNLLTDSAPLAVSNHTVDFGVPTGSVGVDEDGDVVEVVFPTGFSMVGLAVADLDFEIDGVDEDILTDWTLSTTSQTLTFTSAGGRVAADEVITIKVGTHTDTDGVGTFQIINNAATGSYAMSAEIQDTSLGGSVQDSGETQIVVIDTVLVTADVDTRFDFFLAGLPVGYTVNGEVTTQQSSTTTVPFGTLAPTVPQIVGQELRVVTNAIGGFTVTVETNQQLTSSNSAVIDSFTDGTDIASAAATAWDVPGGDIAQIAEWGHWGMTSDDATLAGGDEFGAALYSAVLTTPQEVMYHTTVADGFVSGSGSTTVAYKAEIMAFQEAADDYTAVLTYIATPTF